MSLASYRKRPEIPGGESIPLWIVHGDLTRPAGLVLLYHGLHAGKDGQGKELHSLAEAGFVAVGVDARFHGERAHPDLQGWLHDGDTHRNLIHLVQDNVAEIPHLLDLLERAFPSVERRFGISGISMGGYIAYRAALEDRRLRAVVPLLASPDWSLRTREAGDEGFRALLAKSPHRHPEDFPPIALLAINAGRDENVPPDESREFCERLRSHYRNGPDRLAYREYPDSGHFMREQDWNDAWHHTIAWFHRFLSK